MPTVDAALLEDLVSKQGDAPLERTPLFELHRELGAEMVPFAGYQLPLRYPAGILAEHRHTRAAASLFEVSHMGQVRLNGGDPAAALERLVPGDIQSLAPGGMRYTQFTNDEGGILDDLVVGRGADHLLLVVNADRQRDDIAHLRSALGVRAEVEPLMDRALLALQGPAAAAVLARHAPGAGRLTFMSAAAMAVAGIACLVSRSGYSGEDGCEFSLPAARARELARRLLAEPEVAPAGLGARDTLRLEAGLCLYGHDIDSSTTPVEAGLAWSIGKRRRAEGGFPGAARILEQISSGVARRRVGIEPEDRALAREHTPVVDRDGAGIGNVTSGGFAPSLGRPVAMGYVESAFADPGTALGLVVRGKALAARVARLPFVPRRYVKG